jgi:hypothetical protein
MLKYCYMVASTLTYLVAYNEGSTVYAYADVCVLTFAIFSRQADWHPHMYIGVVLPRVAPSYM